MHRGAIADAVTAAMPAAIEDLAELVAIPSVAFPGHPPEPLLQAAKHTGELLRRAGLPVVREVAVEGAPPLVYGEAPAPPGAPTVLLYAHYDVQTAGDRERWRTDPFTPVIRDGRMYGRGTADNKSGVIAHATALAVHGGRPPCGVKVLVEGEEEYGGPSLAAFVHANRDLLAADAILLADAGNLRVGEPALTTSMRGAAGFTVWVCALREPLHSGEFGGAVPDAVTALVRMLATLHDDAGAVAVPGLPAGSWAGPPLGEDVLRAAAGLLDDVDLVGTGPLADRLWAGPAIVITGLDVPPVAGGVNAIQPVARARLTVRVPPDADPGAAMDAVVDHLERVAPWGVQVVASHEMLGPGFRSRPGGPARTAMETAMRAAYDRPVREIGAGASIPVAAAFAAAFPGAELLVFGAEDRGSAIHAPNERLDLGELARTALSEALFLEGYRGNG
ncbi:M20/M25/M40 family metallo-hydrolase [Dactylosporangium vinaceum]|uniref:M20/M25/M40 family metallo-hydrolase n=1 Tax=Dactylosporangium vinaceum TaxID=53362 RepID=A0ABV5M3U4_9ACTN|nr:M20/M25/M40 family metallo-hydrolase [Dactylosporangium vinaceum]UAB94476.1 M20/M25/M40 family metallo-hydrolase [Dactylosporangium vinaceum]